MNKTIKALNLTTNLKNYVMNAKENNCPVCGQELKNDIFYYCESCGFNHSGNDNNSKQKSASDADNQIIKDFDI